MKKLFLSLLFVFLIVLFAATSVQGISEELNEEENLMPFVINMTPKTVEGLANIVKLERDNNYKIVPHPKDGVTFEYSSDDVNIAEVDTDGSIIIKAEGKVGITVKAIKANGTVEVENFLLTVNRTGTMVSGFVQNNMLKVVDVIAVAFGIFSTLFVVLAIWLGVSILRNSKNQLV